MDSIIEVEDANETILIDKDYRIQRNTLYWYWISKIEAIGIKTIEKLLSDFQSIEAVFYASDNELLTLEYITEEMRVKLLSDKSKEKLMDELR
jgi:ERCC4-type nuclease